MMKDIVLQSPEMVDDSFIYREHFNFQRLTKDMKWYVIYQNQIIAHGQYRNDLREWVDVTYFKNESKGICKYCKREIHYVGIYSFWADAERSAECVHSKDGDHQPESTNLKQ